MGTGVGPFGDAPEWAVKYQTYLESVPPHRRETTSLLSPSSTCASPSTPTDTYPRGLGILVREEELFDSACNANDRVCPMIVIQCDDEDPQLWDGNVTAPLDPTPETQTTDKDRLSPPSPWYAVLSDEGDVDPTQ